MRDAAFKSIAVGFFDGVHLGHRAILEKAEAVLTFRNHPLSVLAPEKAPWLIMSPEGREEAIRQCGIKEVVLLDFTPELAALSPEEFVRRHLGNAKVVCGENWRFGKNGAGDAQSLQRLGLEVEVVPYAVHAGERICSTRIRGCLERGEIEATNAMLGRRFALVGTPRPGKGMGTRLGFPTVNFEVGRPIGLRHGVYEVAVEGARGIANFGLAPTLGDAAWREPVLEVHFLSAPSFDVAKARAVSFLRFIRPERTFASTDELRRQIAVDCASVERGAR